MSKEKKKEITVSLYNEVILTSVLENVRAADNVCTVKCTSVGYFHRDRAHTSASGSSRAKRLSSIKMAYVGSHRGASLPG